MIGELEAVNAYTIMLRPWRASPWLSTIVTRPPPPNHAMAVAVLVLFIAVNVRIDDFRV